LVTAHPKNHAFLIEFHPDSASNRPREPNFRPNFKNPAISQISSLGQALAALKNISQNPIVFRF
jgi:hypothetical protein